MTLAPVDWSTVTAEAERLRTNLLAYSALDMLGNLVFHACATAIKSDAYDFPQVEYAALLFWHERGDRAGCITPDRAAVEQIAKALNQLFITMQRYYRSEADRAGAHLDRADLAKKLRSAGLGIRVPAYDVHQHRVLRGIFGPHGAEFEAQLGFNIEHIRTCMSAVNDHYVKAVASFRGAGRDLDSPEAYDKHFAKAGDFLAFEPAQIATPSGLPAAVVSSILDFFSLRRGEADENALIPSPFSKLRERPILGFDDDRYFVPNHALLLPAVQPRLEQALNPSVNATASRGLWTRYEKHRGKWVEEESYRLLAAMMPGGQGTIGAYYSIAAGDRVEGDVVYQADDAVFLLEGKAGAFTPATLRGAPGSLSDDVTAIIKKGADQCERTEAYVRAGGKVFENADGAIGLTLTGKIREFIRIVVTLDNVGVLSTASAALKRAGYLQGDPTWTLSLTDMMILADVLSQPGEIRHYARERIATLMLEHVLTHDETDYLGMYLLWNQTTIMEGEADNVMLGGHMAQFDDYYVRQMSDSPPHQALPTELSALIQSLAHRNSALWSQAVCDILKLDLNARNDLGAGLRSTISDASNRPRDITLPLYGNRFLTIVLRDGADPDQLRQQFVSRLSNSPMPVHGKRLFIGYDPANGIATAEYYERVDDGHFRVAPSLTWPSPATQTLIS